jgi:alpha-beta hydrolase superfamily lysophospholipase
LVVVAFATMLGAFGYRASRAASLEARTFHPPRGVAEKPADLTHLEGLRDVSFTTVDGLNIRGWYVPSKGGAAVVFVHGSPGTRQELLTEARHLAGRGYGALLFDLPGHGESEGSVTWGDPDRHALTSAIDFVVAQRDVDHSRVGLMAFSMGTAIATQVAAKDTRISAVALAGAFTDAIDQRQYEYRHFNPILRRPVFWEDKKGGLDLEALRTIDVIAQLAPRPLLLVAGTDDPTVPPAMTKELYDAAREPKEMLMLPGAKHGDYAKIPGSPYLDHLSSFFAKSLPHVESSR